MSCPLSEKSPLILKFLEKYKCLILFGSLLLFGFGSFVIFYHGENAHRLKILFDSIVGIATAFGTVGATILALWPLIRPYFSNPVISIIKSPRQISNQFTSFSLFHLKVKNLRPWAYIENCRVILTAVQRQEGSTQIDPYSVPLPFYYQLQWVHESPQIKLESDGALNFGVVYQGSNDFSPSLVNGGTDFEGKCFRGEVARYTLQIQGDNYVSPKQIFEVDCRNLDTSNFSKIAETVKISEVEKS